MNNLSLVIRMSLLAWLLVFQTSNALANTIVVDDQSASRTQLGQWSTLTAPEANGGSFKISTAANPGQSLQPSFSWNMQLPQSGLYDVEVKWIQYALLSSNAIYEFNTESGLNQQFVSQQSGGNSWTSLGQFNLSAGLFELKLKNEAGFENSQLSADAIKLTLIQAQEPLVSAPVVTYYHTDHLGSPVAAKNYLGELVFSERYMPFGETSETEGVDPTSSGSIGYTGHVNDKDLGLTYMGARYYDPLIGRFYGNDPIGYTEANPVMSFNRYLYVNNNPYNNYDPDGEYIQAVYGFIAGASGGYVSAGDSWAEKTIGVVVGGLAGAVIGSFAPTNAYSAGMLVSGMTASFTGQVVSSIGTKLYNSTGEIDIEFSDIKVNALTTVAGGFGSAYGNIVGKYLTSLTVKSEPVIGSFIGETLRPKAIGVLTASVIEGAITGSSEKLANKIKGYIE